MKAHRPPSRRTATVGLTTTAGAIVALMAIAATVTAAPTARPAVVESRSSLAETNAVRAVAAAMAAVARELAGGERVVAAMPVSLLIAPLSTPAIPQVLSLRDRAVPLPGVLDERLLDLPPPGR